MTMLMSRKLSEQSIIKQGVPNYGLSAVCSPRGILCGLSIFLQCSISLYKHSQIKILTYLQTHIE